MKVDIIDAHAHLGSMGIWLKEEGEIDGQIQEALPRMEKMSIRTCLVSGQEALFSDPVTGNRYLAEHAGRKGECFRGYLTFNPFYTEQMTPLLDDFFAEDFFVGFKVLCDYWRVPVTDVRFTPVWEYANAYSLPVLLHTWGGPFNSPGLLKDIVKRYPDAIFLLGHSGGGDDGRREAEELTMNNPNVMMEWCGSFCSSIRWEETLKRVNPHQVVFGTDGVFHDFAWELGHLLSLDVSDSILRLILGDNMRRILAMRKARP